MTNDIIGFSPKNGNFDYPPCNSIPTLTIYPESDDPTFENFKGNDEGFQKPSIDVVLHPDNGDSKFKISQNVNSSTQSTFIVFFFRMTPVDSPPEKIVRGEEGQSGFRACPILLSRNSQQEKSPSVLRTLQ